MSYLLCLGSLDGLLVFSRRVCSQYYQIRNRRANRSGKS